MTVGFREGWLAPEDTLLLFDVEAIGLDGKTVFAEDEISQSRIEELAGKDIAKKIQNREGKVKSDGGYRDWNRLSGLDLQVGGQGMKAFYDQIVPNTLNKLLAKLDAGKLQTVNLRGRDRIGPGDDDGAGGAVWRTKPGAVDLHQPGFTITEKLRENAAGGLPLFSRGSLHVPVGSKVQAYDEIVRVINDRLAASGNHINLVATFADLPQDVQDAADNKPKGLRGITFGWGEIFIVQDKLHSIEDLEKTIVHELYGHIGLRSLFGREIYTRLNNLSLSLGPAKIAELIEKYKLDKTAMWTMPANSPERTELCAQPGGTQELRRAFLLEEALAHIAEHETGTLKQRALELIGQIRAWLRDHGFMALSELGMTDIAHILKQARKVAFAGVCGGGPIAPGLGELHQGVVSGRDAQGLGGGLIRVMFYKGLAILAQSLAHRCRLAERLIQGVSKANRGYRRGYVVNTPSVDCF